MVHISLDRENEAAEKWAADAKLPWLTIMPSNAKTTDLEKSYPSQYVPSYYLVDGEGKALADDNDGESVFAKIKELAK